MIYNYKYLMEIRLANGMSQSMLAKKMELSVRQISRLETSECKLTVDNILKYFELFKDFDINKLFITEQSEGDETNVEK